MRQLAAQVDSTFDISAFFMNLERKGGTTWRRRERRRKRGGLPEGGSIVQKTVVTAIAQRQAPEVQGTGNRRDAARAVHDVGQARGDDDSPSTQCTDLFSTGSRCSALQI